jgi:hypothetical protein
MLAKAVHLADRSAGGEELPVHLLLVFKRQAVRRSGEKGRAAAGEKTEHQIIAVESGDHGSDAQGGKPAPLIGNGMGCFDNFDVPAWCAMAIAGDH